MDKVVRYNHAMTIAFEVISTDPEMPTLEEAWAALQERMTLLENDLGERNEALMGELPFDTYEMSPVDELEIS